jgi:hypothetical protein
MAKAYPAHIFFSRGSSSIFDCATTDRGSAFVGVRGNAAAVFGADLIHRALVVVVLEREILAPDRGVHGVVGEFDHAEEGILRLLFAFHDVHEEGESDDRGDDGDADGEQGHAEGAPAYRCRDLGFRVHGV